MLSKIKILTQAIAKVHQADYSTCSRVHPLRTFPEGCFVKREDELGFGISGSKIRKYRTLIPFFKNEGYKAVVVIGGANSNHVLGISQLLIENGIKPILYLRGESGRELKGNAWFTHLFVDKDQVHWISREQWPNVEEIARRENPGLFVLPEGGSVEQALPGALGLALDIVWNELELKQEFAHIFIDAGTGFMAIALLLAYAWMERDVIVHIVLLADSEEEFTKKLQVFHKKFEEFMGANSPFPVNYRLYRPKVAASFGATNARIFEEIRFLAKHEGFLTDPIYSAKLFLESRRIIQEEQITGRILMIHSGGALALTGFRATGQDNLF